MFQVNPVTSNQDQPHRLLESKVQTHLSLPYCRRGAQPTRAVFQSLRPPERPWILDTGCGTAESSVWLAQNYPNHWVLGLDQSAHRLERAQHKHAPLPANLQLIQADLVDFCLLAAEAHWHFEQVYLLYPNPWPKQAHLQRRWHGHPIFPWILHLADHLEVRSNWEIYLQEFALALELATGQAQIWQRFEPQTPLTNFERKYHLSGQMLYQLQADISAFSLPTPWLQEIELSQQQQAEQRV